MNKILQHLSMKSVAAVFLSCVSYVWIAYGIERSSFYLFFLLYATSFIAFLYLIFKGKENQITLFFLAFGFRILLLFAIPNLSDDFYRFIWDGRMIWEGLNPYLVLPENDTSLVAEGQLLYKGMGAMNGSHYTCYPPVNQFAFLIPAIFFSKNLLGATLVMRLLLILADLGTFIFGKKTLHLLQMPSKYIFLYILNPFIILELTGNLHFEGLMIFFLAIAIYYLLKNKWLYSALAFAVSVSVKLVPLLFVPIFIKKIGFWKTVGYGSLVILLNLLFFLPFMSKDLYDNFMDSIHLYFQNFEFNASIYYIIREIGFQVKGYNIIHSVGKVTPILVIFAVGMFSFFRNNKNPKILFESLLFSICIYYSLASIVHPWYVAIPLFLSVFTRYKFPLVWSFMIVLSYAAYQTSEYHENLYLVFLEYAVVYGVLLWELFCRKNDVLKISKV